MSKKTIIPKNYCYAINMKGDPMSKKDKILSVISGIYAAKFFSYDSLPFVVSMDGERRIACITPLMSNFKVSEVQMINEVHRKLAKKGKTITVSDKITLSLPKENLIQQYKWWRHIKRTCVGNNEPSWDILQHNGPSFGWIENPYVPHNIPFIYDGKGYKLSPLGEEAATKYANIMFSESKPSSVSTFTKSKGFNDNFWKSFTTKKYLTKKQIKIFKSFKKANFKPYIAEIKRRAEEKAEAAAEMSKLKKSLKESKKPPPVPKNVKEKAAKRQRIRNRHGTANVDGHREPIMAGGTITTNMRIFRSKNKQGGTIVENVMPENVILNLSRGSPVPKAPKGHKWGKVVRSPKNQYVWKYTMYANGEKFGENQQYTVGHMKEMNNLCKFEKARKLDHYIDTVDEAYTKLLNSKNRTNEQMGVIIYLVKTLGIRPGSDESISGMKADNDTYGATTLSVKHIEFEGKNKIVLKFPGKKGVEFNQVIDVPSKIYVLLQKFVKGKKKNDKIFDKTSGSEVNCFLSGIDKYFTAKVFRTRMANNALYKAMKKSKVSSEDNESTKIEEWRNLNKVVAVALNHRKTPTPNNKESHKKKVDKLKKLKGELKGLTDKKREAKKKAISKQENVVELSHNKLTILYTTSVANYIDPRLIFSWANKMGIEDVVGAKIYTKSQVDKHIWGNTLIGNDWDYKRTPLYDDMKDLQPKGECSPQNVKKHSKKPSKKPIIMTSGDSSDESSDESKEDAVQSDDSSDESKEDAVQSDDSSDESKEDAVQSDDSSDESKEDAVQSDESSDESKKPLSSEARKDSHRSEIKGLAGSDDTYYDKELGNKPPFSTAEARKIKLAIDSDDRILIKLMNNYNFSLIRRKNGKIQIVTKGKKKSISRREIWGIKEIMSGWHEAGKKYLNMILIAGMCESLSNTKDFQLYYKQFA
jgi:DNA topoisomerase IB